MIWILSLIKSINFVLIPCIFNGGTIIFFIKKFYFLNFNLFENKALIYFLNKIKIINFNPPTLFKKPPTNPPTKI
ncbi:hypothetical protein EU91_0158 [Prochlorococcus marinus str. GP2]|uniref:Uncharacterized protein n=1 Tax=Prochlorococcus marinus str. GP2 TaxID=59925 RepID=A0A0A1ZLG3_PROMR|nr:hypothetical protein EU91_0158 [Prochlorococcus marinus str. GP2]